MTSILHRNLGGKFEIRTKAQMSLDSQSNCEQKNECRTITLNFKVYYITVVGKPV